MKPFNYFSRFPILLLSLFLIFFYTHSIRAGTCVSGLQSGVWGPGGSPSISVSGTGIEDTNLTISSCRITDGDGEGILMNSGASPLILNTLVENHAETGIVELAPSCHPVVRGCSSKSNGGYAVEAFAGNVSNYARLFIAGNQPNAFRITSEPITTSGEWLS